MASANEASASTAKVNPGLAQSQAIYLDPRLEWLSSVSLQLASLNQHDPANSGVNERKWTGSKAKNRQQAGSSRLAWLEIPIDHCLNDIRDIKVQAWCPNSYSLLSRLHWLFQFANAYREMKAEKWRNGWTSMRLVTISRVRVRSGPTVTSFRQFLRSPELLSSCSRLDCIWTLHSFNDCNTFRRHKRLGIDSYNKAEAARDCKNINEVIAWLDLITWAF